MSRSRSLVAVEPSVTESLAQWSAARGGRVRSLSAAFDIERRIPRSAGGVVHPNFERRRRRHVDERVLVELPQARLWGPNGLVVLPDGSFAAESIYDSAHLRADPYFTRPMPSRTTFERGDFFTLVGEYSNEPSYYHFIHEGLLRLHDVLPLLPPNTKMVVPAGLQPFKRELLQLFGIPEDRLVAYAGDKPFACERLWFASMAPAGAEVPDAVAWFRAKMFEASGGVRPRARRRLYLTRDADRYNRVVNERDLVPVLERHGFEIVRTAKMSVVDQVRLFAEAEAVVGPTGSAMANLIFASPDTRILEILEPEWAVEKAYVLWALADTLGQPYWWLLGDNVPNASHERADVRVDPEHLDSTLRDMLG